MHACEPPLPGAAAAGCNVTLQGLVSLKEDAAKEGDKAERAAAKKAKLAAGNATVAEANQTVPPAAHADAAPLPGRDPAARERRRGGLVH